MPGPKTPADNSKNDDSSDTPTTSHSLFVSLESPTKTPEEAIQIAERVVREMGFESLEAFNKYDLARQAANAARSQKKK